MLTNTTVKYPNLDDLMAGFINEDAFEITGHHDYEGMVDYYTSRAAPSTLSSLIREIDEYRESHSEGLDAAFCRDFDYGAGIENATSFLSIVTDRAVFALRTTHADHENWGRGRRSPINQLPVFSRSRDEIEKAIRDAIAGHREFFRSVFAMAAYSRPEDYAKTLQEYLGGVGIDVEIPGDSPASHKVMTSTRVSPRDSSLQAEQDAVIKNAILDLVDKKLI